LRKLAKNVCLINVPPHTFVRLFLFAKKNKSVEKLRKAESDTKGAKEEVPEEQSKKALGCYQRLMVSGRQRKGEERGKFMEIFKVFPSFSRLMTFVLDRYYLCSRFFICRPKNDIEDFLPD
jgi:hypothetical protein